MGSKAHGLSSSGSWVELLHGMWDLPGSGIKALSLALAGFFTTESPGKPLAQLLISRTESAVELLTVKEMKQSHLKY